VDFYERDKGMNDRMSVVQMSDALAALERIRGNTGFIWAHDQEWGKTFSDDCNAVQACLEQLRATEQIEISCNHMAGMLEKANAHIAALEAKLKVYELGSDDAN
jgi:hypothetical protein